MVFTAALGAVLVAAVVALALIGLRSWREERELKALRDARRQARHATATVSRGLQTMATIVPELGPSRLEFSARAMDLLDTQSALLLALWRDRKQTSRRRFRGLLVRQLREIAGLDAYFERFQQAVLTAVCAQAAQRVVMPPVGVLKYRATFTVLEHRLPAELWPTLNGILARHVQLWVRDATGNWAAARRIGFRWGRELVFSRKNLEQATELRLLVDGRVVSEFTVEHERAVPSGRGWFGRWPALRGAAR